MNVGVSMKFGNSNPYAGMSKGRLIEYVEKQTSEIDEIESAERKVQNERNSKTGRIGSVLNGCPIV